MFRLRRSSVVALTASLLRMDQLSASTTALNNNSPGMSTRRLWEVAGSLLLNR